MNDVKVYFMPKGKFADKKDRIGMTCGEEEAMMCPWDEPGVPPAAFMKNIAAQKGLDLATVAFLYPVRDKEVNNLDPVDQEFPSKRPPAFVWVEEVAFHVKDLVGLIRSYPMTLTRIVIRGVNAVCNEFVVNTSKPNVYIAHTVSLCLRELRSIYDPSVAEENLLKAWKEVGPKYKYTHKSGMENILEVYVSMALNNGNLQKATSLVEEARIVSGLGSTPQVAHLLGCIAWEKNDLDDAARKFQTCLKLEPTFLPCLLHDAILAIEMKRYKRAWEDYKCILEYYDDPPAEVLVGLALVFYCTRQYQKALFFLDQAIPIYRVHEQADQRINFYALRLFRAFATLMQPLVARPLDDRAELLQSILSDIHRARPEHIGTSHMLVWLLCDLVSQDPNPESLFFVESLSRQSSMEKNKELHALLEYTMGKVNHAMKQYQTAEENYKSSLKLSKGFNPAVYGLVAVQQHLPDRDKKTSDMIANLEKLKSLDASKLLSAILTKSAPVRAYHLLKEVTSLSGANDPEAWAMLAETQRRNSAQAIESLKKAKLLQDVQPVYPPHYIPNNIAAHYLSQGDVAKATDELARSSVALFDKYPPPSDANITRENYAFLCNQSRLLLEEHKYEDAEVLYRKLAGLALSTNPLIGLAICCHAKGNYEEEQSVLNLVLHLEPSNIDAIFMLYRASKGNPNVIDSHFSKLDAKQRSAVRTFQGNQFFHKAQREMMVEATRHNGRQNALIALEAYELALQEEETNVCAQHNAGCALALLGKYKESRYLLEGVQAMHTSEHREDKILSNLAGLHMKSGAFSACAKAYGAVLCRLTVDSRDKASEYVEISLAMGIALLHEEVYHEATLVLQRAMRVSPVDIRLRVALGMVELAFTLREIRKGVPIGHKTDEVVKDLWSKLRSAESVFARVKGMLPPDSPIRLAAAQCESMVGPARASLDDAAMAAQRITKVDAQARDKFKRIHTEAQAWKEQCEREKQAKALRDVAQRQEQAILLQRSLEGVLRATAAAQQSEEVGARAPPHGTTTRERGGQSRIEQQARMVAEDESDNEGDIFINEDEYAAMAGPEATEEEAQRAKRVKLS